MFSRKKKSDLKKPDLPATIILQGYDIEIKLRRNARARRLILRQDIQRGGFTLTLPKRTSLAMAERFIHAQTDWLLKHHAGLSVPQKFQPGDQFPLIGRMVRIEHDNQRLRGLVRLDEDRLIVPGDPSHLHRRVRDYLKEQIRATLTPRLHDKASRIDRQIKRIRIADQKTRWGSCSSTGTLSFSCRLVFAPEFVIDYLAAHEVAHMRHMDHSTDFWTLCRQLCDTGQMTEAKAWLKQNQSMLMHYAMD